MDRVAGFPSSDMPLYKDVLESWGTEERTGQHPSH